MSFNLYAAGAGSKRILELKRRLGYDQLLSQYTERKACIEWVEYKRAHPECQSKLFIDSGAFTAFTKKKVVDVDEYIEFINSIDDQVHIFAQVDKIPGEWGKPRTPKELAEAPKLSWENYLYMVNKVKSPEKLLPIFHQGEDFSWLKNMLNYKYTEGPLKGQYIKYIGISCSKDITSSAWAPWFDICFKIIAESDNPNVKTHAFGMTSLKLLEQYPFTSGDSTSWVRSAGFGNIMLNGTTVYTSSRNPSDPGYIKNLNTAMKEDIDKIARKYGYSFFEVADESTKEERQGINVQLKETYKKFIDSYNKINNSNIIDDIKYENEYIVDIKESMLKKAQSYIRELNDPTSMKSVYSTLVSDLEDINASGEIRCLFNLCSLKEWANNYEYRGTSEYKEELW